MPRAPRFKVAAISELLQQLRFAPEKTRLRQMDAAERLVSEIDPSRNYPQDFIVYRITGYRPDDGSTTMLVGEALLPDLVNFVLHISRGLHLARNHEDREALRLEEVASKLRVSSKTLQRHRAKGLVCHYVYFEPDRQLLACFDDALKRYTSDNQSQLDRAAEFTRISKSDIKTIIDEARSLRHEGQLSLNQAARQIAQKQGRAHETVRLILHKHDRESERPVFATPGPVSNRVAELMYRAWRLGVPINEMAARFHKTPTTVHRAINRQRASRLQAVSLTHIELPTFQLDDAATVILSHPAVISDLNQLLPQDDALAMIGALRERPSIGEDPEQAMIAAFNFLKRRAAATIAHFPAWPGSGELDEVETDLRWAHRIKRRLVAAALPAGLRSIEQHLHRSLDSQPAEVIVARLHLAIEVIARVVESIDPSRGQRLVRLCGQAVDRALASTGESKSAGRAAMRHRDGSVQLGRDLANVTQWAWLDERSYDEAQLTRLPGQQRKLLRLRHGVAGQPPRTYGALAVELGRTASSVARKIATAERNLRTLTRS